MKKVKIFKATNFDREVFGTEDCLSSFHDKEEVYSLEEIPAPAILEIVRYKAEEWNRESSPQYLEMGFSKDIMDFVSKRGVGKEVFSAIELANLQQMFFTLLSVTLIAKMELPFMLAAERACGSNVDYSLDEEVFNNGFFYILGMSRTEMEETLRYVTLEIGLQGIGQEILNCAEF